MNNTTTATSNHTVCVTGASGFIAAHMVQQLLNKGYPVHGTVRDASQPDRYAFLTSLEGADSRLTLYSADLLAEGSYAEAINGCDVVMHTASPYVIDVKDPQRDLVDPAVQGTLNVLNSCLQTASVKRVVLTSSMAAITDEPITGKAFSEQDWNQASSLTRNPYYYSKTAAERAAWEFMDKHKPSFDLVVINPFMVIGPSLSSALNTSNKIIKDIVAGAYPGILALNWGFVDVRDVALAHILAMETPSAKGRYLCAHETRNMKELVAGLAKHAIPGAKLPRLDLSGSVGTGFMKLAASTQPKGVRSYLRSHLGREIQFNNSKIRTELGIPFRSLDSTLKDTVEDLQHWQHIRS